MKFTTTVAMPCTEDQYNKDLKDKLSKLGYPKISISSWSDWPVLITHDTGIYNVSWSFTEAKNADVKLDIYDPELFLALATMTDNPTGIQGEWWKFNIAHCSFTKGKLYQQMVSDVNFGRAFISDSNTSNGFSQHNTTNFVKATKEEIIAHFNNTKTMNKEIAYILKKEFRQMNKACQSITGFDSFDFTTNKTIVINSDFLTQCYNDLKAAGVLDLWFEEVVESREEKLLLVISTLISKMVKSLPMDKNGN